MSDKDTAIRIYETARTNTFEEWQSAGFVPEGAPPEMAALVHRTANECSQSEFVNFVVNGEMPETELSEDDLDQVAGGAGARRKNAGGGGNQVEDTNYFNFTVRCSAM